jgi:Tol biopolymer transport system component
MKTQCTRITLFTIGAALVALASVAATAAPTWFGHSSCFIACTFGPAQNLGSLVNSPLFEGGPTVSTDEKTLIFAATRDSVTEQEDLFISQRTHRQDHWGAAEPIGLPINDPVADEFSPRLSHDGKALYFGSNRAGGFGKADLYVSTRESPNYPWNAPQNLGPLINTVDFEGFPTPSADGNTLYFNRATAASSPDSDIWLTTRENQHAPWGLPQRLAEPVNSTNAEFAPSISVDGLTLYFASARAGNIGFVDIWVSTRQGMSDPWGQPVNLGPNVNSAFSLTLGPFITTNGRSLYFMSTRRGELGQPDCQFLNCFDLYVARRECHGEGATQ